MSKVTVTGNVTDITGSPDPDQLTFFVPEIRDGVLSTRRKKISPNSTTGAFSVQLEAGPAAVIVRGTKYSFTAAAGDLSALIALALAVPPETGADKLQEAVDRWAASFADGRYASQSALTGKADLQGGKLVASQLPDLALIDYLGSVSSQSAMLALTGQKGDWCVRSDSGTQWIITGSNPTQIGSWTQIPLPTAAVTKAVADVSYNAKIPQTSTAPTSPSVGDLWLDTSA